MIVELQRPTPARFAVEIFTVGGFQRIEPQVVLEIGEHQFLVLLLMVQAQFDAPPDFVVIAVQQARHRGVHVRPVVVNLAYRGPRQETAPGPRIRVADAVVVGVEQRLVTVVDAFVARFERPEQKGLEEPGGVRQVPLGRAGIVHGLHAVVLDGQRLAQRLGLRPYPYIKVGQAFRPGVLPFSRIGHLLNCARFPRRGAIGRTHC